MFDLSDDSPNQTPSVADISELQFRSLFDMMPQLGWTARPDGWVDFLNRGYSDFTGQPTEQLLGWGWKCIVHPDDIDGLVDIWKNSIATAKPFETEFRLRRNDGEYRRFVAYGKPVFDERGTLTSWVGINTDIHDHQMLSEKLRQTQQKLSRTEPMFRVLAESLPDLVWAAHEDGRSYYFNQRWLNYTGTSLAETVGDGWQKSLHPDDVARASEVWRAAVQAVTPYDVEYRIRRHDGEYRWFIARGLPVKDQNGTVLEWAGTCSDIHDAKNASAYLERQVAERTAELSKARDAAEKALESKTRFLTTVSHEVRTPMASVIGLAELLSTRRLDGESQLIADEIFMASRRLLRLLNDMLDTAKLDKGTLNLEVRRCPLRTIPGDVAQLIMPDARKKSLAVTTHVAENVPEHVLVDELRVRQVLLNLAFNAVKFTNQGSIDISLSVLEQTPEKLIAEFKVSDTGIGVEPEKQQSLFEPFMQVDSTTTQVHGGSGLGLAISRQLVELMKGNIGVKSELSKGSEFWFTIPLEYEKV